MVAVAAASLDCGFVDETNTKVVALLERTSLAPLLDRRSTQRAW